MYRAFRGAEPDKSAMLVARGLVDADEFAEEEEPTEVQIIRVDTREQARQRAERSRREREAARLAAQMDSLSSQDSLQSLELMPRKEVAPVKELPLPIKE